MLEDVKKENIVVLYSYAKKFYNEVEKMQSILIIPYKNKEKLLNKINDYFN